MKFNPMLATLIEKPFNDPEWLFEVKYDGYRALAQKNKSVQLMSRGKKSFNPRFPDIVHDLEKLPGTFVADGEIVILDAQGRSHFQLLQNYQKRKEGVPYYYLFDILSIDGRDLTHLPLIERKKILKKLLGKNCPSHLRYSEHVIEQGKKLFQMAERKKLEGIVAKKIDSPYQFKRSSYWLKIKTKMRQEVVIAGFTAPRKSRIGFGSLLLGVYEKGHLVYVGHVGTGFDEKTLVELHKELKKLATDRCPFVGEPISKAAVTWVKPQLVCEVAFAEWTESQMMRQPVFKGMRIDKKAIDVTREYPKHNPKIG